LSTATATSGWWDAVIFATPSLPTRFLPSVYWLAHHIANRRLPPANVTMLETRPAPPDSDMPSCTVADGVDDALRLAPTYLIVGEVRTGDAALSLFRALMRNHVGLTTFHAEGPEEAVFRLGAILFADAGVRFDAAKGLFAQAIDLVVHVGWRGNAAPWASGKWQVRFRTLWTPGEAEMGATKRKRRSTRTRL
jgi:pilus assembly protein CpaF